MKPNPGNERIKREYFAYLREAGRLGEDSIDAVAKALDRFETCTRRRDFKKFHFEQAIAFKAQLSDQPAKRTGEKLSKATILSTLAALKKFFYWLRGRSGFKSIQYDHADYFHMSFKDTAIAKARREPRVPTLDQILFVLANMPCSTPTERRDQALIACALITGARDDALASMRLKHVDLVEGQIVQDARDMRTKFSKSFQTWFFPVSDEATRIFVEWVEFLRRDLGFGPDDPVFPPTRVAPGPDGIFAPAGFMRECWSTASPIRAIFKTAFEAAGLPYFNPHSFRKTLTRIGMELNLGEVGFKAWSQNLGHDNVATTYRSYGELPAERQRDLIRAAATIKDDDKVALELGRQALAAARSKKAA